jgi:hypothetical protein
MLSRVSAQIILQYASPLDPAAHAWGLLAITISDSLPADFTVTPSTIESTAPGQLVNVAEKKGDGWGFDRFPGRLKLPSTKRQKEGQLKDSNARNFIWIFSML